MCSSTNTGKQLVLVMKGHTIDMNTHILSTLTSTPTVLASMPMGMHTGDTPEQYYRLVNNSTWDMHYRIDISELEVV